MPTVNLLTSGSDTNNAAIQFITASVSPTAGARVFLAAFAASGGGYADAVSGLSATWTQRRIIGNLALYEGVGWSGSGTITIDDAVQDGCVWIVFEVTGASSDAIVTASATGTATSGSVTMPTPAAGSCGIGIVKVVLTGANQITPGSGYTELGEATMSGPATTLSLEWRSDAQTTVDASFASNNFDMIGIEVKTSGGGGGPTYNGKFLQFMD